MKHIKLFEQSPVEDPDNINRNAAKARKILPQMVEVSNNSKLTVDVSQALAKALSPKELDDFYNWLKLITPTSEVLQLKNKSKRGF